MVYDPRQLLRALCSTVTEANVRWEVGERRDWCDSVRVGAPIWRSFTSRWRRAGRCTYTVKPPGLFFSLLSSHCHRLITRSHRLVRNPRKNTPSRGETEMVGKDPTLIYNDNLARVHRRRRGMELERIASGLLLTSHHADKSGSGL